MSHLPFKAKYSDMHLTLVYWQARTLGEGYWTVERWQETIQSALGICPGVSAMTASQAYTVLVHAGFYGGEATKEPRTIDKIPRRHH